MNNNQKNNKVSPEGIVEGHVLPVGVMPNGIVVPTGLKPVAQNYDCKKIADCVQAVAQNYDCKKIADCMTKVVDKTQVLLPAVAGVVMYWGFAYVVSPGTKKSIKFFNGTWEEALIFIGVIYGLCGIVVAARKLCHTTGEVTDFDRNPNLNTGPRMEHEEETKTPRFNPPPLNQIEVGATEEEKKEDSVIADNSLPIGKSGSDNINSFPTEAEVFIKNEGIKEEINKHKALNKNKKKKDENNSNHSMLDNKTKSFDLESLSHIPPHNSHRPYTQVPSTPSNNIGAFIANTNKDGSNKEITL